MTTLEDLPKELMINILSRLPPDSVFQFMPVNKFWYALINDPSNSPLLQHKHIIFMRLQKSNDSQKTQLILSDLALDPSMSLLKHFQLPLPFDWNQMPFPFDNDPDFYENFHIHSHSHGLVCLTDYRKNIILCNPTTREFRKLPPSLVMLTDPAAYMFGGCGNTIGFGYDPKSKDFKVVRIVCYMTPALYWRLEVFDLSKDRWREVEVPDIIGVQEVPSCGTYHEGTLFWVIITTFNYERPYIRTLYSFDISEEIFGEIRLPKSIEENEMRFQHWDEIDMGVLNGSIVIFHKTCKRTDLDQIMKIMKSDGWDSRSVMDIWKMEKNDESGIVSWSKSFTINLNSEIGRPFMFLNSYQVLTIKKGQIGLYNVRTQRYKELPMRGHAYEAHEAGCLIDSIMKGQGCEATYFVTSSFSFKGQKY